MPSHAISSFLRVRGGRFSDIFGVCSRPLPERVFFAFFAHFGRPWGLSLASFGYFFHDIFSSDFWMHSGVAAGSAWPAFAAGEGVTTMTLRGSSSSLFYLLIQGAFGEQPPTPLEGAAGSTTPSATTGRAPNPSIPSPESLTPGPCATPPRNGPGEVST